MGSERIPRNAFVWRRRRDVIPLDNFDFPAAHVRAEFDGKVIGGLVRPRMAGSNFQMSAEEIRDAIRSEDLTDLQKSFLEEVFEQCDGLDIRQIRHFCGGSLYELARTMIACKVRQPFVAEWMNCRSPNYSSPDYERRRWRFEGSLGR